MTNLSSLLKPSECSEIKRNHSEAILDKHITDLTIQDLSHISLILIRGEYSDKKLPNCFLSAAAIEILFSRAIILNKPIF